MRAVQLAAAYPAASVPVRRRSPVTTERCVRIGVPFPGGGTPKRDERVRSGEPSSVVEALAAGLIAAQTSPNFLPRILAPRSLVGPSFESRDPPVFFYPRASSPVHLPYLGHRTGDGPPAKPSGNIPQQLFGLEWQITSCTSISVSRVSPEPLAHLWANRYPVVHRFRSPPVGGM